MTKTTADSIIKELEKHIQQTTIATKQINVGTINSINNGVVEINGLIHAKLGEMLDFGQGTSGVILNLNKNNVGAVILGDYQHLKAGDQVSTTNRLLSVPVSEKILGRVMNPLGEPMDDQPKIKTKTYYPLEKIAPGIIKREAVNQPLYTGIKVIDSMIPIGRGQRELIIGDRGTGKSSIALTSIINQKKQDVICIYVMIGQKSSFIAQTINTLEEFDAMKHTIIIAAPASSSPVLQYIAPYAGTAIAEYFMDQGKDVLVVHDDLTKHAWAYREISLLLHRPSGREAYPGDVFYLHSRLLERSCKLNQKLGGGSITALPIIETQEGDVSAYIPTNVISITDGQIYLEPDLFNSDIKPAINVGLSVSRVGGAAQIKAMKQTAGKLRLDLAQFRELAAFSQFASDLDEQTRTRLDLGKRLTEILKQNWDDPYSPAEQIIVIWAATNNHLNNIKLEKIKDWETEFISQLRLKHQKLIKELNAHQDKLTKAQTQKITKIINDFNKTAGSKYQQESE